MAQTVTRAEDVLGAYRTAGRKIVVAESCTGGLLAGALTTPAGASDVFDRGFVTYSNTAKTDLLGVTAALIAAQGAVSEPVAVAMAVGALARSAADVAVSVTGIAGPGGSDTKPEGRVCFGLARTGRRPVTMTVEFGAIGRDAVRLRTTEAALRMISDHLQA